MSSWLANVTAPTRLPPDGPPYTIPVVITYSIVGCILVVVGLSMTCALCYLRRRQQRHNTEANAARTQLAIVESRQHELPTLPPEPLTARTDNVWSIVEQPDRSVMITVVKQDA